MQPKTKFALFFALFLSMAIPQIAKGSDKNKVKKTESQQQEKKQAAHEKDNEDKNNDKKQNHRINVQVLNSPVRQKTAEFSLELPQGFIPGKAEYEIKSQDKKQKSKEEKVSLENKNGKWLAKIPVDNLEPGNFKIEFEVKAAKSWMQTIKEYISRLKNKNRDKDETHPNRGEYKGVAEFEVSPGPEMPPDPGEAGMLTLEGIDSNNDGVRDDVERWIIINYGDSEKTMSALAQAARVSQERLLNAAVDKTKSIEASYKVFRASDCLEYVKGLKPAIELYNLLDIQLLNTDARIRANIKASANFSGQVVELQDRQKTDCDFDPDTLPN